MYYIEKMIDGILYCKTTPNGEWKMVSNKALSYRLEKAEEELFKYKHSLKYKDDIM